MKNSVLTTVFAAALVLMFIGVLLIPAAATSIVADTVKFDPKRMDLYNPDEIVTVRITFPSTTDETEKMVLDINTTTVLLDGTLPPIPGSNYTHTIPPEYFCDFDGYSVRDILWMKIYHVGMEPNPQGIYVVNLTITGNLYDGTPFSGVGHIQVKPSHHSSPPPPPP